MGAYISFNLEIGGRALIGAWALKGTNTVYRIGKVLIYIINKGLFATEYLVQGIVV